MPPRSGTSDGSETSPPRDQHKVTPGNGMVTLNYSMHCYSSDFVLEYAESSERSQSADDDESIEDTLSSSPARPSIMSCKYT